MPDGTAPIDNMSRQSGTYPKRFNNIQKPAEPDDSTLPQYSDR